VGQADNVRVAAIQAAPVFLDRDASLEKAVRLIKHAASEGAHLAAFGEAWLPGYPVHGWAARDTELWWELAAAYLDQSVDIPGPAVDALCSAAREGTIDVVIGVSERDPITRGSIYSTLLLIGSDGQVTGRHRKIKPALHERVVWADGDAIGLEVHDRGYASVSALNSTEHQMMLPAYALVEQGTQIHVAAWPGGETAAPPAPMAMWPRQHLLSRAFAAQAGAFVICAAGMVAQADLPERYRAYLTSDLTGDSAVIDPRGEIIAGPSADETVLLADCQMALVRAAKVAFDCAGHASRRDQLKFWNPAMGPHDDDSHHGSPGRGFDEDHSAGTDPTPPGSDGKV
jgi:nitrilase